MAPVNQNWTFFQDIDPESDHARRIRTVLQNANFNYLSSKVVEIRKQEEPQLRDTPICFADITKFTSGYCNLVVALTFSDSVQWVARIRLPQDPLEDPDMSISMLSETSTMNLIRAKTSIPVPRVFGYSENMKDDFGYPYILMEALPGNILDRGMALSIPDAHEEKFTAQLAAYIHELSTIRSSKIGRVLYTTDPDQLEVLPFPIMCSQSPIGPLSTSLDYFYRLRKDQTKAILNGQ